MTRITIEEAMVKYSLSKPTILKYVKQGKVERKKIRRDARITSGGKPYYLAIDDESLAEVIQEKCGELFIA